MAILAAGAAILLVGCSRQANLQGDVFVTERSGTVQRGTDLVVMVVPATSAFEQERAALEGAFRAAAEAAAHAARLEYERRRLPETPKGGYSLDPALGEEALARQRIALEYQPKARELFTKHSRQEARTDVNGHFEFKALEKGKVYLYAEATFTSRFGRRHFAWLVPVDLKEPQQKVDLSGSNSGWAFER